LDRTRIDQERQDQLRESMRGTLALVNPDMARRAEGLPPEAIAMILETQMPALQAISPEAALQAQTQLQVANTYASASIANNSARGSGGSDDERFLASIQNAFGGITDEATAIAIKQELGPLAYVVTNPYTSEEQKDQARRAISEMAVRYGAPPINFGE
jgi:hypothetical protein